MVEKVNNFVVSINLKNEVVTETVIDECDTDVFVILNMKNSIVIGLYDVTVERLKILNVLKGNKLTKQNWITGWVCLFFLFFIYYFSFLSFVTNIKK